MARRPIYLRQWRKHRGLSQETASDRLGISQGTLSKLERGASPYNPDILERMATEYNCAVADLLSVNPLQPDPAGMLISQLRTAPKEVRERAYKVLDALLKAG